jgi:hypothetical protein
MAQEVNVAKLFFFLISCFRYAPKRKFIYAPKKSPTFPAKLIRVPLHGMQITYTEFKKYRTIHVESTDIYIYIYIYIHIYTHKEIVAFTEKKIHETHNTSIEFLSHFL